MEETRMTTNSEGILSAIAEAHAAAFIEKRLKSPWEYFEYSVKLVLARWTALRMAIEGGWGGGNLARKYEILLDEILNVFKYQKKVQAYDLVLNITEYVESEFGLICEDNSIEAIVDHIISIAEECKHGEYKSVEVLHHQMQSLFPIRLKEAKIPNKQECVTEGEGVMDDVDEEGWTKVRRSSRNKQQTKVYDPEAEFPGAR